MSDSLPQRMRQAAEVLLDVDKRCYGRDSRADDVNVAYGSLTLRRLADEWEAEDNAAAEHEALVEELAKTLLETCHDILRIESSGPLFDDAREGARKLIDAGWTKQVTE